MIVVLKTVVLVIAALVTFEMMTTPTGCGRRFRYVQMEVTHSSL